MPSDPDDDDSPSNTIIVKNEDDAACARRSCSPSSRSPAPDSMSPGSPNPAGLAEAARAASPRRRLQSPEPLGDDRPRRRLSPNRHHHQSNNNSDNTSNPHKSNLNGNHNIDVRTHRLRSSPAPARQRSHARDSSSSHTTGSSQRPASPASSAPHSNKRSRPNVMTTEERLMAMPEKRAMPWRPGVDPGADIETGGESRRKQIRFGCLLATRGEIVPAPCVSCANGRGKFSVCVADPTLFRGACAGCQLSGRPNRCSIKQGEDNLISPNSTPEIPARNVKKKLSKGHHSPLLSKLDHDKVPTWHNGSPKWPQQEYTPPQQPQPQHPETAAPPQPRWATVNAAPAVQPPAQLKQQQPEQQQSQQPQPQQSQQSQQPLQYPLHQQPPPPPPQQQQLQKPAPAPHTNGITITLPPPNPHIHAQAHAIPIPTRSPMGWATVNQQQHRPQHHVPLPPYPLERSASNGVGPASNGTKINTNGHSHGLGLGIMSATTPPAGRNGTTLPSFPAPLHGPHNQPHHPQQPQQPHRTSSRDGTGGPDSSNGIALIDTLPKTKQRQVYGVISGLQAGIEQLQRELGALKKSLGVGDDD